MKRPLDAKTCPWCGDRGRAYHTERFGDAILRYRKCEKCGATWKSSERFLENGKPPLAMRDRRAQ